MDAYAAIAATRDTALSDTVLRTRSLEGRNLLAYLASNREADYQNLTQRLSTGSDDRALDAWWLGQLARVVAFQRILDSDLKEASSMFQVLEEQIGLRAFSGDFAKIFAEVLLATGAYSALGERLPTLPLEDDDRTIVETDLQNPFMTPVPRGASVHAWSRRFTRAMGFDPDAYGELMVVREMDDIPSSFDRLDAGPFSPVDQGPLVTVIVTAYQPTSWLTTALRSLIKQTWRNLEILVVDDGSPGRFAPVLEAAERMDGRIRLVCLDHNAGTYAARNQGMELARGQFITFQDSDDWSHPLRVERQVQPMLEESNVVATTSSYVRTGPDLSLLRLGYPLYRRNVSSLMIKADPVLGRLGFMDRVRKGADAEYLGRIQAVFPDQYRHIEPPALAVIRSAQGSLSQGEARAGWHHAGRFAYRSAFHDWHKQIVAGRSPYLAINPESRPFPAPTSFHDGPAPTSFDLVVIADWRPRGGHEVMVDELRQLIQRGWRIGFGHIESFRHMSKRRREQLIAPLRDMEFEGDVGFVLLDDKVDVESVIIRDPTVLQFPPCDRASWNVRSVLMVEADSDGFYLQRDVLMQAERLFGAKPTWISERAWKKACRRRRKLQSLAR